MGSEYPTPGMLRQWGSRHKHLQEASIERTKARDSNPMKCERGDEMRCETDRIASKKRKWRGKNPTKEE